MNRRGNQVRLARFEEAEHQTESERFEPDSRLFLVVERPIENACVEIKAHGFWVNRSLFLVSGARCVDAAFGGFY